MRNLLVLLLIIIGINLYGQTDSIEKATLYNQMMSKGILQEKFTEIAFNWKQTVTNYPDLPLDQNEQVHYTFLNNFKNMNKAKLFNRALEYLSINYGLFPATLYSNLEDGKIIYAGNYSIDDNYSVTFTGIISIKDEKILTEFINIGYQVFHPEITSYVRINTLYPIILKNPKDWKTNIKLFAATNKYFKTENIKLSDYSQNFESDYTF